VPRIPLTPENKADDNSPPAALDIVSVTNRTGCSVKVSLWSPPLALKTMAMVSTPSTALSL
jgi:hypothetical protein